MTWLDFGGKRSKVKVTSRQSRWRRRPRRRWGIAVRLLVVVLLPWLSLIERRVLSLVVVSTSTTRNEQWGWLGAGNDVTGRRAQGADGATQRRSGSDGGGGRAREEGSRHRRGHPSADWPDRSAAKGKWCTWLTSRHCMLPKPAIKLFVISCYAIWWATSAAHC